MFEKEGPGWRLAKDSSRGNFSVLIGGNGWAIELTKKEWESLFLLIKELVDQYKSAQISLLDEEEISLEMERSHWWACIEGTKNNWSLKLILKGDEEHKRGAEMYWPIPAAQLFTSAMRIMWDCSQ
tara:strand:- start:1745 stop:2122 length:378 start_codon:yes stop_codon:yes gene_type:complete